ncbi:MAG: DUF2817 domain-containing protein [Spirochaetia bacterium]|nr:DUF2817 domain-containing protein [Spirochaetia bacterium]
MISLRGLKRLNRYENRIYRIARLARDLCQLKQIGYSRKSINGFRFPVYSLVLGKKSAVKHHPVGLIAGVHGLETVGVRVLLDFLENIFAEPGQVFRDLKKGKYAIICIPILNPGGVAMKRRSNPGGVDLMRNSGVESKSAMRFFGGQKVSQLLPYYRGKNLQPESRTLFALVREYLFPVRKGLIPVLDIHSGFGMKDSLWWPYAGTTQPCPDQLLYERTARILCENETDIVPESQSNAYTIHGDLWDYLYNEFQQETRKSRFLPFTLEIGTWKEIKKEPMRLFSRRGMFNPLPENKADTILRYRNFLERFVRLNQLYSRE